MLNCLNHKVALFHAVTSLKGLQQLKENEKAPGEKANQDIRLHISRASAFLA
jgi:hypothetical protein